MADASARCAGEIFVRHANVDDVPAILAIYNDAVLKTTASADYTPRTLDSRLGWFEDHRSEGYPVLVAIAGGAVIGWSSLSRYHTRPAYRFTAEDSVYVAESWRGHGVGQLLLAPLIAEGERMGLHLLIASIAAENEASLRLHASLGFIAAGRMPQILFKFERWLDLIYMVRLLSPGERFSGPVVESAA